MEVVTDAACSVGRSIKKSIKGYHKEAKQSIRSFKDFVDIEDFVKSIYKERRESRIIHHPIDWSKYSPSAFRQLKKRMNLKTEEKQEMDTVIKGRANKERNELTEKISTNRNRIGHRSNFHQHKNTRSIH